MTNQDPIDETTQTTQGTTPSGPDSAETATDAPKTPDSTAPEADTDCAPDDPFATMSAELNRWKDLALRAQADFDNFRKRTAREITEIRRYAASDLLADLLPVLDNFDLGLMAARNEAADSAISLGMSMVRRQLDDFLTSQGVKEITAEGETFDPTKHDAVATEPHATIPDGTIIRVARKGYFLHERVLRAPSVIVSKGPEAPAESTDSAAS